MAQVSQYPEVIDHKMEPPPEYSDIDNAPQNMLNNAPQNMLNNAPHNMLNVDDKIRSTLFELEGAKHEIGKAKSFNNNLDKKVEEAKKDRDSLRQKIDSLKVKLGMSNTNLNKSNDEKEKLSTNLNESQVLVARLEERLSALSTDLDRMRDPANPESNMSIRKHIINDKKDIKKLKVEAENEMTNLEHDLETSKARDAEIKALEKELAKTKDMLAVCKSENEEILKEEEVERGLKEEMIHGYKLLIADRKTYDQRLKEARVRLGVMTSGKNVNIKVMGDMKKREKLLTKKLTQYEKKLKEATGDLDILKNQDKMSKTAMSINKYTRRNQSSKGEHVSISLAQGGTGPVKFAAKPQKSQPETNRSRLSEPDRSRAKGGDTDRSSNASLPLRNKGSVSQRERQTFILKQSGAGGGDKKNAQFIPPPKAKLKGNAT